MVHVVPLLYTILKYLSLCHICVLRCGVEFRSSPWSALCKKEKVRVMGQEMWWAASCMPLAKGWTAKNRQTLHCLWLGQFYPRTVRVRLEMNQVLPSTLVFSCSYHCIRAACFCYQKDNLVSCVIWQSNTNCNTEVVQSIATLNTVLVKKTLWYFLFRFCRMNHPHLCLLHFQVIYVRFLRWGIT